MGKPPAFRALRSRATETHQILRDEILAALESIIFDSYHNSFTIRVDLEKAFAAEVQQNHAVAVHSGTVGLFLALRACGIGAGDEVITVGNSDISTTGAISQCGGVPVLCDVLLSDYTVNPDLVENLITDKTRALLPVDMHGHPANVKLLRPIADHYGLKIVEDAALASGAFDYGLPVGAFADITMFSFSAFKPLGSSGNGAMLVTNSDELCEKLRLLAGYGHDPIREGVTVGYQNYVEEGYNVPLDGLEAAVLSVKLPYLKEWTKSAERLSQRSKRAWHIHRRERPCFAPSRRRHSVPMRSASTDKLICTTGLETPESKHLSVMRRQYMIIPFTPACSQTVMPCRSPSASGKKSSTCQLRRNSRAMTSII